MVTALFDGDDIGPHLELMLLEGRLDDAATFSTAVSRAMSSMVEALQTVSGVEIIFCGGDDLVAQWPEGSVPLAFLQDLRTSFQKTCTRTLSAGLGPTPADAVRELRLAKLRGKNSISSGGAQIA